MTLTQDQMNEKAKKYRESAAGSQKRSRDSFDNCDTDGFLSQWANDITARELIRKAEILEAGGVAEFTSLCCGMEEIDAKMITGQYGLVWLLDDEASQRFGRRFVPTGKKSRIQKELGLYEGSVMRPAWACIASSGTGLSGCASAYIRTYERDWELTEDSK